MLTGKPLLTMTPAFAAWNTVARFDDYETAQRAVDRLSDFSSVRALSASRYDLIAREGTADRARAMLGHSGLLPAQA
jgi:hypothetical protein